MRRSYGRLRPTLTRVGWENCYLLDSAGLADPGANSSFAWRLKKVTDIPSSDRHSDDKAWIVGPVLGALLAVLLVCGAVFWWRRRARKRRSDASVIDQKQAETLYQNESMAELPDRNSRGQPYELSDRERHELQDPNSEKLFQHEISN